MIVLHLFTVTAYAADTVTFYHTDPAGTPLAMSDSSGTIVWKADYKPFGEEQGITGTAENNKRFVGKEKDTETGLNYFGARYLKDRIGRFTSVDPVGPVDPSTGEINEEILLNPQRLNKYAYGLNNPYRYVDPDGKVAIELVPIVIAIGLSIFVIVSFKSLEQAHNARQNSMHKESSTQGTSVNTEKAEQTGPKAENASGQTASGQATDQYGNKLGPSGKQVRHKVEHSTEKGAKDSSRLEGKRAIKHPSPKKGNPHYHPADKQGNKIPGSTHHEY